MGLEAKTELHACCPSGIIFLRASWQTELGNRCATHTHTYFNSNFNSISTPLHINIMNSHQKPKFQSNFFACPFSFFSLFGALLLDGQEHPLHASGYLDCSSLCYSPPSCSQKPSHHLDSDTHSQAAPHPAQAPPSHDSWIPLTRELFKLLGSQLPREVNPRHTHTETPGQLHRVPHPVTAVPNCADVLVIVVRLQASPGHPMSTPAPPRLLGPWTSALSHMAPLSVPSTNVYRAFVLAVKCSERKGKKLCIQYKITMKCPQFSTNFICTLKIF